VNLGKKLSTDVLVTTVFNFATRLRGIVFIPVISGILGVAAYGAYSQLLAVTSLLAVIFELGLHGSLVRYAQNGDDTTELYYSLTAFAVIVGVIVAVVLYVAATPLSNFTLGSSEYAIVFQIGSVLVPLRIWGKMAGNYFRSEMQVKFFSGLKTTRAYISIGGVLIVLLVFNYGLPAVISVVVSVELLYVLFVQSMVTHRLGIASPSFEGFIDYFRYSVPLMTSIVASNISSRIDRILIGIFLGPNAVGIYTISYQIATSISLLQNPITSSFFPEFSRLIEENKIEKCLHYQTQGVRYYVGLGLPAIGGLYLIGPDIIQRLSTVTAAESSVVLLPIISVGIFISGLDRIYGVLLVAAEKTKLLTYLRGIGAIANIFLNILFIPILGIVGAAVATVFTYGLVFLLLFYKTSSIFDITFNYLFFIKSTIASLLMIIFVIQSGLESLFSIVVISVVSYTVVLYVMDGYTISEFKI